MFYNQYLRIDIQLIEEIKRIKEAKELADKNKPPIPPPQESTQAISDENNNKINFTSLNEIRHENSSNSININSNSQQFDKVEKLSLQDSNKNIGITKSNTNVSIDNKSSKKFNLMVKNESKSFSTPRMNEKNSAIVVKENEIAIKKIENNNNVNNVTINHTNNNNNINKLNKFQDSGFSESINTNSNTPSGNKISETSFNKMNSENPARVNSSKIRNSKVMPDIDSVC